MHNWICVNLVIMGLVTYNWIWEDSIQPSITILVTIWEILMESPIMDIFEGYNAQLNMC